mgnify:CR=1 FL=1
MKRLMMLMIFAALLVPVTGWAGWTVELQETYRMTDAVGFLQNSSGDFQGPGLGSGVLYGPFAVVKRGDFEVAQLLNWHFAGASRVGGTGSPEGSKLSVAIGISPVSIMGVHAVADWNAVDKAFTWGLQISATDVISRLTKR